MKNLAIMDSEGTVTLLPKGLRISVDTGNIAYANNRHPLLHNFIHVQEKLQKLEAEIFFIAPASLKYKIDDTKGYIRLLDKKIIKEAPAGVSDDLFILEIAREFNTWILSNDRFKEYQERYREEINRRITFMIIQGKVIIPSIFKLDYRPNSPFDSKIRHHPPKEDSCDSNDENWLNNLYTDTETPEKLIEGIFGDS